MAGIYGWRHKGAVWLAAETSHWWQPEENKKSPFSAVKVEEVNSVRQVESETLEPPSIFNRSISSPAAERLFVSQWRVFLSAASALVSLSAVSLRVIRSGMRIRQGSSDAAGNQQNDQKEDQTHSSQQQHHTGFSDRETRTRWLKVALIQSGGGWLRPLTWSLHL